MKAITLPSGKRVTLPDAWHDLDEEMPLADFHVLRAVAKKLGLDEEEEIEITCQNCGETLRVRPCSVLETGPWENAEANDPELDETLPFGEPLEVGETTVTFGPVTVAQGKSLFAAPDRIVVDEGWVRAMGIVMLGGETNPKKIARTLETCEDEMFGEVTDAWIDSHYVLRLAGEIFCKKCNARNTVDAPADREFDRGALRDEPLPPLEEFVELAHAIADPLLPEDVELVVEDGVPAVDDGGEPLLGSYVPPPPLDAPVPMRPGVVTIYYRTFASVEDWKDELRETIEHELEHHEYFLRGHDPMDEEEHDEIDREALRVVGATEAKRRVAASFADSLRDFLRRAWPLVAIAAAVLALTLAQSRCGGE